MFKNINNLIWNKYKLITFIKFLYRNKNCICDNFKKDSYKIVKIKYKKKYLNLLKNCESKFKRIETEFSVFENQKQSYLIHLIKFEKFWTWFYWKS